MTSICIGTLETVQLVCLTRAAFLPRVINIQLPVPKVSEVLEMPAEWVALYRALVLARPARV
jgi:hypothetical protein